MVEIGCRRRVRARAEGRLCGGERVAESGGEAWTVGRILKWCEEFFRTKGSATARLDAEILLAHVLGCSRVRLYVDWRKVVNPAERAALRSLVARRGEGEPVAYLVGKREFWSLEFKVDRRVLIPRPETEHVVEAVLEMVDRFHFSSPRVADIGTGCGNIACALAKSLPTAKICASDISQDALEVAEENARSLGLSERIEFLAGDLTEPLRERGGFDVVAANPPYVAPEEWREVPVDVRCYEPRAALCDQEPDGLGMVRRLLKESPAVLNRPGVLVCEIGHRQAESAERAAVEIGYREVSFRKDYSGKRRVLVAVLD